ncbi:hypothetical protein L2X99_04000 [Microbacterium sp. KUDC0406]|uniref:hypothetical protein n=1 Tax=Microbacterium sp. KUDC0406 TaxID=2909588 RepID=UPI001F46F055|nr:hypothetical protein [Microbacterium sp. KUDC0406]UJP10810.1 hypothetical protein L2X99_04000 [Microbacterium sp. KUDC0406]
MLSLFGNSAHDYTDPGSACPHYLGEPGRQEKYRGWVGAGVLPDGHAADDYTAIVWRDGEVVEAVSERGERPVVRVRRDGSAGIEDEVPVRVLS